ncbi:MAG TPA: DUF4139 domain-containing protein [Acidobacteriota bacterium]
MMLHLSAFARLSYPLAGLLAGTAIAAEPTATSTAADRTSVAVTVYNDGRGLVREEREVELPAGIVQLRFMDVAEQIDAPTVHVGTLQGGALSVLEQNYEYDLLSPEKLLEKYVGQTVTLVQQKLRDNSTVEEEVAAKLLSTNNGTVWEIDGRIAINPSYNRVLFPSVPANLIAKPTLVWLVDATGAGRRTLEAAYLTGGMSWRADYVLALDAAEAQAGLQGWVTVDNQSGTGFENARLKLVAGDVHRAQPEMMKSMMMDRAVAAAPAQVQEEALFEYHLYTVPRLTTLKQNQTKQVQLLDAPAIQVGKDYVLRGGGGYFRSPWGGSTTKEKIQVFLKFKNAKDSGLGLPLPKGIMRVYKRDRAGSPQFIGEDRIDHTPKDEEIRLQLGNAFDLSAERRQTDFQKIADRVFESAYEIKLRNHKESAVTIRVIEPVGGDWTLLQNSHPFTKTGAFEAEFAVPIAPDQEAVLTYRVRVTY